MEERQELQQYRKNMTWLMEAKRDFPAWFNSTLIEAETHQEKRVGYNEMSAQMTIIVTFIYGVGE